MHGADERLKRLSEAIARPRRQLAVDAVGRLRRVTVRFYAGGLLCRDGHGTRRGVGDRSRAGCERTAHEVELEADDRRQICWREIRDIFQVYLPGMPLS